MSYTDEQIQRAFEIVNTISQLHEWIQVLWDDGYIELRCFACGQGHDAHHHGCAYVAACELIEELDNANL